MTEHDEAVEASAKAIHANRLAPHEITNDPDGWHGADERTRECCRYDATAALTALRAYLAANGLRVVPVVATEGMVHGGGCALDHPGIYMSGPSIAQRKRATRVWETMVECAPYPLEPGT